MEPWPPWFRSDHHALARYVCADAGHFINLGFERFALAQQPDGQRRIIQAIYEAVVAANISYDIELYTPKQDHQIIRRPFEILRTQRTGTCLDLAILFAGLCLDNRLIPIIVVLDGHALVAVSLTHWVDDWSSPARPGITALRDIVSNIEILRDLQEDDAIIAVECTGFARSDALACMACEDAPETIGRTSGIMTFENAVSAGKKQLHGRRPLLFAIDMAAARHHWEYSPYRIELPDYAFRPSQLTRLKYLLADATLPPENVREAFLLQGDALPSDKSTPLIYQSIDELGARPPAAIRRFLDRLQFDPATAEKVLKWISDQPSLVGVTGSAPPPAPVLEVPVVLIKVTPAAEDRSVVLVDAWLFDQPSEPPRRVDVEPSIGETKLSIAALPDAIEALVTRSQDYLPRQTTKVTVELVLPMQLLQQDVERWEIKVGKHTRRPLGRTYALALRSYDRLYDPEYQRTWLPWRSSWGGMPRSVSDAELRWALNSKDWDDNLFNALRTRGVVFVGLTAAGPNELEFLLDAGTPVALWFRSEPQNKDDVRDAIRSLICGRRVTALPGYVQGWRTDKLLPGQPNVEWDSLALMQDDPGRMPPDITSGQRAPG